MPIDTPFNREIARQYNASNRKRAKYMEVHMFPMSGNELIIPPHSNPAHGNGYNMRMIGSGVGNFKKESCCSDCEDGASCSGGNNKGLQPSRRMAMDLGAGRPMRGGRQYRPNTNSGNYGYGACNSGACGGFSFKDLYEKGKKVVHKVSKVGQKAKESYEHLKKAYDSGRDAYNELRADGRKRVTGVAGGRRRVLKGGFSFSDLYEKGKKVVHKVSKIGHKAKEGYEHLKKAYDSGRDIYNELRAEGLHDRRRGGARADIVRQVMRDQGLNMIQASKFVKANNLY